MVTVPEYLTPEQILQFNTDGFLKIPGFLSPEQTQELLKRSQELLAAFDPTHHPLTKFSTGERSPHVGDDYFLASATNISYFLEEDAVSDGKLTCEPHRAVNKIGHALHVLDPTFRQVTLENKSLQALVRDLKFHRDPVALQSMVITKQPKIGGAVPPHIDSTFLYTSPPTALGFWIALDPCTPTNGALSFLLGSHIGHHVSRRFVRVEGGGTGFEDLPKTTETIAPTTGGDYVMVECNPGDLVLIHGSVLHKSERNSSGDTRLAYTFHMIDSPPHAIYDSKNWLQPTPEMPFSRILPTGEQQTKISDISVEKEPMEAYRGVEFNTTA